VASKIKAAKVTKVIIENKIVLNIPKNKKILSIVPIKDAKHG